MTKIGTPILHINVYVVRSRSLTRNMRIQCSRHPNIQQLVAAVVFQILSR